MNVFVEPAEKPEYCPDAGSLTVRDGVETSDNVLTVHELPEVGTLIVTLVPVVARDDDAEGLDTVRHCAPNATDENAAKAESNDKAIIIVMNAEYDSFLLLVFPIFQTILFFSSLKISGKFFIFHALSKSAAPAA